MESGMRIERVRRNFSDESNRYDAKRKRLVHCARSLGEDGNAGKISVTDVTAAMGITRGLFYYYFGSKEELNQAIADTYVEDLLESVKSGLDEDLSREEAIRHIVNCIHNWMYDENGESRAMLRVLLQIGLEGYVRVRVADELSQVMLDKGLLADYGGAGDGMLAERARFVVLGLLAEIHLNPELTVDMLSEVCCSALRYRRRRGSRL